ncbi:50S ribosomal protein L25/general stress protein Ctc [Funiculus sociatus]|uniref:50S ribosomal protein L25/general stress protein Ctc n=1 Tax=Funiculus sociatus TaxID=450527 RepID=UPI00329A3648
MQVTVECQKRPEGSKPNALRRSGLIPVVLYGHKGTESLSLTMPVKKAEVLLRESSVNNTLIDLNIPEISWSGKTLLKEVQKHPWKNSLYHLSFFAVAAHGDLDIEVPLHFVGEAAGVKQDGGLLDPVLTQLQVRCAPESIPDSIEIDVSNMQVGDALHLNELVLPPGVTTSGEPDQVIVSVLPPQITPEPTETEEATESE